MTSPAIEPYYTEAQVALLLDPSGKHIKARSIRSEREGGRLVGSRIAGKWLYRQSDVLAFLERARRCPPQPRTPRHPPPPSRWTAPPLPYPSDRVRPQPVDKCA